MIPFRRTETRKRPHWSEEGLDPDYRFSLANERTFLAWIRTALALMAGAVALKQLIPGFAIRGLHTGLGLVLAGLGMAIAVNAYRHWAGYERAMREERPLPRSRLMPWVSGLLALAAVIVVVVVLTDAL